MNKSIGLLKSMMKKNYINKPQTVEVNHSNRYSPSKKQKRQIISINKASKGDFNSNIEKKKIIYQQSIQKLDKTNKLKLSQNKKYINKLNYPCIIIFIIYIIDKNGFFTIWDFSDMSQIFFVIFFLIFLYFYF